MAKKPDITTITTGYFSTTMLNNNFEALQNGFDNTLSLDGSTPNAMSADFDLNDNDILNAGTVNTDVLKVAGVQVTDATYVPEWEGEWTTATSYVVNDLVRQDGNVYICLEAHTSGTFSTDLAASKWELFASKGSAGTGTGDLLSTNNLSDLTDADAALSNLGGLTKGIEIFKDSTSGDVLTTLGVEAQSTATWETGTGTTESVVSPAKVKAAIDAVAPELTQVQVEDDTDTTFGLVSGERLGQAVAANVSIPDPETGLYTVISTVFTSSGSSVSITGLDETKSYLLVLEDVRSANDSTSENLRIRFSSNNGSSYSSSVVISENNVRWDTNGAYGEVRILKPAGIFESATTRGGGENNDLYKLPLQTPSGMTSTVDAVRFEWNFGDFAAGNIKVIEVS